VHLDERNRTILSILSRDPDTTQGEIARKLGLSQPSIAQRISTLKKKGALDSIVGVDPWKTGLTMVKVELTTSEPTLITQRIKGCPYVVNIISVTGRSNLTILLAGSDVRSLQSMALRCLQKDMEVSSLSFDILTSAFTPFLASLSIPSEVCDEAECGKTRDECSSCAELVEGRCRGCPAMYPLDTELL